MARISPNHNATTNGHLLSQEAVLAIRRIYAETGSLAKTAKALGSAPTTIADALAGTRQQRATVERLEATIAALDG